MQPMAKTSSEPEPDAAPSRRRYSSGLRRRQAEATRAEVLAAATDLFVASGWAGTTVAAIAKQAGVAVETVYSGFGSKKELLRRVVGVAVVGDADAVPLAERAVFTQLGVGDHDQRVDAGVAMLTDIHERIARLWRTVHEAAASDDEIDGWRLEWEEGRRLDVRRSIELILGHEVDETTLDLLWSLFSHETYSLLVFDHGLTRDDYVARMRVAIDAITAR
jgi:AcrR family transcriptional regulator